MKKWKRWIAIVLVSLLCLSLCGCQRLEDMRAVHAVWQEDGNILWDGNVYHKLEVDTSLENFDFTYAYDYRCIYVTEADVPVLLSNWFGDLVDVRANGMVLEYYNYRLLEEEYQFYCREDVYDEVVRDLTMGVQLNTYFYPYYDFDSDESKRYYLTEEQANTMHRILTTVTPVTRATLEESIQDALYLSICDENRRFEQDTDKCLLVTESCYCIESYGDIYIVPMEYTAMFAEIWKAYGDGKYVLETPPSLVV